MLWSDLRRAWRAEQKTIRPKQNINLLHVVRSKKKAQSPITWARRSNDETLSTRYIVSTFTFVDMESRRYGVYGAVGRMRIL